MKNQIQIEEQAPANANQLTAFPTGTKPKAASDRMAKLGEFRILTLRETPAYVRCVTGLARFYHRSPDQIVDDEIKAYLLHLLRIQKLAVSSIIVAVSGLRFF